MNDLPPIPDKAESNSSAPLPPRSPRPSRWEIPPPTTTEYPENKSKSCLSGCAFIFGILLCFSGAGACIGIPLIVWILWKASKSATPRFSTSALSDFFESHRRPIIGISGVVLAVALLAIAIKPEEPPRSSGDSTASTSSSSSSANESTHQRSSNDRFEVGQEVTVPARTGLTHNGDLLREVVLERNEERQNELLEQLVRVSMVTTTPASATIIDIDREDGLCKIEMRNGVTWWVKQSKLGHATASSPSSTSKAVQSPGNNSSSSSLPSSDATKHAYNLAVVEAGGAVSKNSEKVVQLAQLVEEISRLTNKKPERIADCVDYTRDELAKQGVRVSFYRLLSETRDTLRGVPAGTVTFEDALALVGTVLGQRR